MKPPAFQMYATDWLGSQRVQMMTLQQEGAYIRLVCYCWQHGTIPRDPKEAARLIGKGASTTLAASVLEMFIPASQRGRLTHDRLEEQRAKYEAWSKKSAEGGRKSAEIRSKGGSTVVQLPYQPKGNIPSPIPSPVPSSTTKLPPSDRNSFTPCQKNLTKRFHEALNSEWENDRQKWMGRIKNQTDKAERVLSDLEEAIKMGTVKTTPAQYAEHRWKEFA